MIPPLRLRDDPAFRRLGCDLDDELLVLERPDLAALRARLVAPLAPPPSRRWHVIGAAGLLLLVLGGHLLSSPRPESRTQTVPAITVPARGETVPTSLVPLPLVPAPSASMPSSSAGATGLAAASVAQPPSGEHPAGGTAAAIVRPPHPTDRPVAAVSPPPTTAPASSPPGGLPVANAVVAPSGKGHPTEQPQGDLAEQAAAFERAESALEAGNAMAALEAYRASLSRWPAGSFRAEAAFGELRAAAQLREMEEVERLAGELADDPVFAGRREEILALRAEALVALGRCAEARALAATLDDRTGRLVRRSCR